MITSSSAAASTRSSPRPCFRPKGKRVLVLERSDRFGGCMRTEEITLPGFHHDVMAATFVLFLTSPAHAALGADLARHGSRVLPHAASDRGAQARRLFAGADHRPGGKHQGPQRLSAAMVTATQPMSARSRLMRPSFSHCLAASLWSWPTAKLLASSRPGSAAFAVSPPGSARRFARCGPGSRPVTVQSSQALYAPWVLHTGLTTESAYGGQMGKVIAFALRSRGRASGQGRLRPGRRGLQALIEENGGELRTGAMLIRCCRKRHAPRRRLADGTTISGLETSSAPSPPASSMAGCCAIRRNSAERHHQAWAIPPWPRQFPAALRHRWPNPLEDQGA
jgi:phytoene dehydrogenase-like protein